MTQDKRKIAAVVSKLLEWYSRNARDLPWRRTIDPYCVFVSEVMLQQTQVKTVLPYYDRWLREFPDVRSLARASSEKIHKLWEGLGYYTRVRNLQKAAQLIVEKHRGIFPAEYDDVLELPGVGRYTAGAVCSIAFDQPRPILDGNVIRVLTRLFCIRGDPRGEGINQKLWKLAGAFVREADAQRPANRAVNGQGVPRSCADLNQALMELGALVCSPKVPRCSSCPLMGHCSARRQGVVHELPGTARRAKTVRRYFAAFILEKNRRFLVRQRPAKVVNAHLWEFPNIELATRNGDIAAAAAGELGGHPSKMELVYEINHTITRYRINLRVFKLKCRAKRAEGSWLESQALARLPFSSAHGKIVRWVLNGESARARGV